MAEEWVRWRPLNSILSSHEYFIAATKYDKKQLSIIIAEDDLVIRVIFDQSVIAYRVANEWYQMRLTDYLYEQNVKLNDHMWTFYKVNNSSYFKSFAHPQESWHHYGFYTDDSVIDVIATQEPIVEEIQSIPE